MWKHPKYHLQWTYLIKRLKTIENGHCKIVHFKVKILQIFIKSNQVFESISKQLLFLLYPISSRFAFFYGSFVSLCHHFVSLLVILHLEFLCRLHLIVVVCSHLGLWSCFESHCDCYVSAILCISSRLWLICLICGLMAVCHCITKHWCIKLPIKLIYLLIEGAPAQFPGWFWLTLTPGWMIENVTQSSQWCVVPLHPFSLSWEPVQNMR